MICHQRSVLKPQPPDVAPTHRSDSVVLLESVNIPHLIGYTEGWFSVQDDHAQLCTELLSDLTALDSDAERLQRVHNSLARLQLAPVVCHLLITQS